MESKPLVVSALVKALALVFCGVTLVSAQTQNKVVEWSKSPIGSNKVETAAADLKLSRQIDGVEIEDIGVASKSVIIGEPFAADDDWLKSFTVRVKNISAQRLVAVQITLVLPAMSYESPDIVFCYGCAKSEGDKGVMPGEEVELKMLGGGFYDWVKSRITEKGSISRITKAEIHHMYVTLPDGTKWFSGCIRTANPKNACPTLAP